MNKERRKLKKKRLETIRQRREKRHHEKGEHFTGTITVAPGGYGFLQIDNSDTVKEDIFIPAKFINGALDGDVVEVGVLPKREGRDDDRGITGRVVRIISAGREYAVGELLAGGVVRPLNRRLPPDIEVSGGLKGAKRGDWVRVKLDRSGDGSDEVSGRVVKLIGHSGEITGDLDAICAEYGLTEPYTTEEEALSEKIEQRFIEREDLRRKFTVTIDPADAKDFDDAISIAPGSEPNEVEIGVHIADVASYITPGSKLDKAAEKRSFTAYLPGRTLPMLPKTLTAKISLQAGVDSSAHSVIMYIDRTTGEVKRTRRCHTLIRVNERLDYDTVQRFYSQKVTPEGWTAAFSGKIKDLLKITARMRDYRQKTEEFIGLEMPEIRVICDEKTNTVSGLVKKVQAEADFLVEECMLAANSAVGKELAEKHIPGLFRVHPEPEDDKIAEFRDNIMQTFHIAAGDLTVRQNINKFIASLPDDPRRPLVLGMLLRSMPRALYSEKAALHFGLGKLLYAHFTSPIRRYTDLAVHQQLWNLDLNMRLKNIRIFAALAASCSEKEKNNDDAYFAANDRLKLRYLQENLDGGSENLYEGVIARIAPSGLTVEIISLGLYGFVPSEYLPGAFARRNGRMRETDGHRGYSVGDFIYLQISSIDFARGQAVLRPVR